MESSMSTPIAQLRAAVADMAPASGSAPAAGNDAAQASPAVPTPPVHVAPPAPAPAPHLSPVAAAPVAAPAARQDGTPDAKKPAARPTSISGSIAAILSPAHINLFLAMCAVFVLATIIPLSQLTDRFGFIDRLPMGVLSLRAVIAGLAGTAVAIHFS